eukprot:tig00000411_g573.t1
MAAHDAALTIQIEGDTHPLGDVPVRDGDTLATVRKAVWTGFTKLPAGFDFRFLIRISGRLTAVGIKDEKQISAKQLLPGVLIRRADLCAAGLQAHPAPAPVAHAHDAAAAAADASGMPRVFVTYAAEDLAAATRVCEYLSTAGYTCKMTVPNARYRFEKAMRGSDLVVLFASPFSGKSEHVLEEVFYARELRKMVFTAFLAPQKQCGLHPVVRKAVSPIYSVDFPEGQELEAPPFLLACKRLANGMKLALR